MRDIAVYCVKCGAALPDQYLAYARIWFWLGVPAFLAMMVIFFLMVLKPS